MDYLVTTLTSTVVAACVSSGISYFVGRMSRATALTIHKEKFDFDCRLAERKFEIDAALAKLRMDLDLQATDRAKKQELAEQTLVGFYQMEAGMKAIRSPGSWASEARDRPKTETETPETSQLRDTYYIPLYRYEKYRKEFAEIFGAEFRMAALFGDEAFTIYAEMRSAISETLTAADMLMTWSRNAPNMRETNPTLWEKQERAIWGIGDGEDAIGQRIASAVGRMRTLCNPILSASAPTNFLDAQQEQLDTKRVEPSFFTLNEDPQTLSGYK